MNDFSSWSYEWWILIRYNFVIAFCPLQLKVIVFSPK